MGLMNPIKVLVVLISCSFFAGCWSRPEINEQIPFQISDHSLTMQLVSSGSDISTPIGLAVDALDNLYVLESHTHTPPEDYSGPAFDLIKRGVDQDGDGIPESWQVYADSLEDGMNLAFGPNEQLFVTTKNAVWKFNDLDGDGVSDQRKLILDMVQPESPYDHAAILGLAVSPDHSWLFVSRGNTGSAHWIIKGTDGSTISGYGDGGNVMRCRLDGSELEEVATGFWNPFDIKFTTDGRLLLTDNDPDSRGPNRLIELVPGGDYGYKSLYGGSGLHPFVAWNGELPGTLPYAAPLGEAPCALLDAGLTGFGPEYQNTVLINIWEEKNIVKIPLDKNGSSVSGVPEVLIQGDSTFHPVALAANSKGVVYITDWVLREYPNHGQGRIWRLSGTASPAIEQSEENYKFNDDPVNFEQAKRILIDGDPFQKAMTRFELVKRITEDQLKDLLKDTDSSLRVQGLLVAYRMEAIISNELLGQLLQDADDLVRKTALFYIGSRQVTPMQDKVVKSLQEGLITADMFAHYLATVQNLQTEFVQGYQEKMINANALKRPLPDNFMETIIADTKLDEQIRALALPYLEDPQSHSGLFMELLETAKTEPFQLSLINAIRNVGAAYTVDQQVERVLIDLAMSEQHSDRVRSNALAAVPGADDNALKQAVSLLDNSSPVIQYAAVKYLSTYADEDTSASSAWKQSGGDDSPDQWAEAVDGQGDAERGELVFKARTSMCQTCHKVDGWGGTFGPDLTRVGSSKNSDQLINAIVNPSLEMAPEWQGWYVIDQDGNRHVGRQIDVHLHRVELMNIDGEFDSYPDPQSDGVADNSVMPEGLQNTMTPNEFNDLIAYLESLE
jgi:putative membrane-bound dehydrogenase-like protein